MNAMKIYNIINNVIINKYLIFQHLFIIIICNKFLVYGNDLHCNISSYKCMISVTLSE